jgi:hypothetical protein
MAPPGGGPMYGGAPGGGSNPVESEATTWLIIAAAITFFCCCNPLSLIGAVFAFQAKDLASKGNLPEATAKLKIAKTLTIVGVALGALGFLASFVGGVFNSLMSF